MMRRFGCKLLVLALLCGALSLSAAAAEPRAEHSHCICGKSSCSEAGHRQVIWQPLRQDQPGGKFNLMAGYYYLETDIVVSEVIATQDNSEIMICLNGHAIRGMAYNVKGSVTQTALSGNELIHIQADNNSLQFENHSKMTICDCRPNAEEHWIKNVRGTYMIAGSEEECIAIDKYRTLDEEDGWFELKDWTKFKGGVLASCNGGTCVSVPHNTDFTVYGGTFLGGITKNGVDVWNEGYDVAAQIEGPTIINLYGGTITNNNTGINIPVNYSATIQGSPKIFGNKNHDLYMENHDWPSYPTTLRPAYIPPIISITGPLAADAKIGIYKRFLSKEQKDSYDQYEVVIARGTDTYQITEADWEKFSPRTGYTIDLVGNELIQRRGHKHDASMDCKVSANSPTFTMLTSKTLHGGPLAAGSYFLAEDVALDSTLQISGEVNLCLCGRQLSLKEGVQGSVIEVLDGGKLTLCDCRPARSSYRHTLTVDGEEKTVTGGLLTGGNAENGGAICVRTGGDAVGYGISMAGNTASGKGGAAYIENGGSLTMSGRRNSSSNQLEGGLLQYNQAAEGGAVWNAGEVTLTTAEASYNKAAGNGGGLWNGGRLTLNGVTASQNTAVNGGGVYNDTAGTMTTQGVSAQSNTAGASGGGIYNAGTWQAGGSLTLNANTAQNGGGAYNAETGRWEASTNGSIRSNRARASGGGIYNAGEAALRFGSMMSIEANSAAGNGGGICDAGTLTLDAGTGYNSCRIAGNKATGKGNGIFLAPDTVCGLCGGLQFPLYYDPNGYGDPLPPNIVYLSPGAYFRVTGAIPQGTLVRLLTEEKPTAEQKVLLAEADAAYQSGALTEDDAAYFLPQEIGQYTTLLESGKVWLALTPLHEHEDGLEFDKVLPPAGGTLPAGHYYLMRDVGLQDGITLTGEVYLCLNGHTLSGNAQNLFRLNGSAKLHIHDCQGEGCIYNSSSRTDSTGIVMTETRNELHLHGGTIRGFGTAGVSGYGLCRMYGGEICNNKGPGVWSSYGAFEMHGGSIHDNDCSYGNLAGGVSCGGTAVLYGGSIVNNKGGVGGFGFSSYNGSNTLTLAGPVTIAGNKNSAGADANLYLHNSNAKLTILEDFSLADGRKIGIRSGQTPTKENPIPLSVPCGADYSGSFVSDDPQYFVVNAGEGAAQFLQLTTEAGHVHDFGSAWKHDAENHWKECECGEKSEEAAHDFGDWESNAEKHWKACECGAISEEAAHNFGDWESDGEKHWRECECGAISGEAAHVFGDWESDGEKHWKECECGAISGEAAHDFGDWESDAEKHWKDCECGVKSGEGPHAWDEGTVTTQPTETEAGEKTCTCADCGRTKTEPVPPLGHEHDFGGWQSDDDNHWKECACGLKDAEAPHAWDDGEITTPPTQESEGVRTYTCTVCERTRTEPVPKEEEPTYVIGGEVLDNEENPLDGVLVELKQGNKVFDTDTTHDGGKYQFKPVPRGLYNVVATQEATETRDKKIMTTWVRLTDGDATAPTLIMPRDGTNSVLDVGSNPLTPDVVVAGLAKEAEELRKALEDEAGELFKKLTVGMAVEGKPEEKAENAQEIRAAAGEEKKLSFLEIGVTMTVVRQDGTETDHTREETGRVMRIVVPFDFTGKHKVEVYRYHGGEAAALTPVEREFGDQEDAVEGCYFADAANGLIYIYAQKFSTYAIGYEEPAEEPEPAPRPSGGGTGAAPITYAVRLRKPDGGAADIRCSTMSAVYTEDGVPFRRVRSGAAVTLALTPDAGWRIANVRVLDDAGRAVTLTLEDGVYRFTQPSSDVTVYALFSRQDDGGYAGCPRDTTCPIWPYDDAETRAWYHDGVHYSIEKDLMIGVAPQIFVPERSLSRAMMAQILYNRAGRPAAGESPFPDVTEKDWYHDAVAWGAANGILLGYTDGNYGPGDPVTREQMAAMLWRSSGSPVVEKALSFTDAGAITAYAAPALRWAADLGVLNGYGDGTLRPRGETTRAEAAQMLLNYFGKLGAVLHLPQG